MDGNVFLIFVAGVLVRVAIPVLLTGIVIWWLRKLDERWERESKQEQARSLVPVAGIRNLGCWKINDCPPERRHSCPAYAHPETPCWQVYRSLDGQLSERCPGCRVFREAPVPA